MYNNIELDFSRMIIINKTPRRTISLSSFTGSCKAPHKKKNKKKLKNGLPKLNQAPPTQFRPPPGLAANSIQSD